MTFIFMKLIVIALYNLTHPQVKDIWIFFISRAQYHQIPFQPSSSSQVEPFILIIHFVLVTNYIQIPTKTLEFN